MKCCRREEAGERFLGIRSSRQGRGPVAEQSRAEQSRAQGSGTWSSLFQTNKLPGPLDRSVFALDLQLPCPVPLLIGPVQLRPLTRLGKIPKIPG